MFVHPSRWLTPPKFSGDVNKLYQASLVHLSLLIAIGVNLVVLSSDLLGDNTPPLTTLIGLGLLVGNLAAYFLMRRGHIQLASAGILLLGLMGTTLAAASLGTIRTPTTAIYLMGVIAAGLLFDRRGLIGTILFCTISVAGLIVAENAGWLPRPDYAVTVTQWLMYTIEFSAMGLLIRLAWRSTRLALQRADQELAARQQTEAALRELNGTLELRVAERTAQLTAANEELGREIVERARAEAALRENEALFSQFLEHSPIYLFVKDHQTRTLRLSRNFEQMLGRPLSDLIGQTASDLFPADLARTMEADDLRLLAEGQPQTINEEFNGRFYTTTKFPIQLEGHPPYLAGYSLDVTERILAEAALRASEERFRQLAENIREVFWLTNQDASQFLYVSPAYEDIYGLKIKDLLAQPTAFLEVVDDPDDRNRISDALRQNAAGQSSFVEYRITRADGTSSWIWNRSFPVINAAGKVERIAGIAEDVSEFKRAEDELRRALIKEQELGELKSQFISMASHDFRTPLTSILTSADLLEHYSARLSEEKKLAYVRRIQTSVRHMTQLLDDVLIIGRADAGKLEFAPGPIDLVAFSRALLDELRPTATPHHSFEFEQAGDFTDTWLDEKLVRQIITNLLSNAIKYSPAGGPIRLSLRREAANVLITVADHGLGIPPEAQLHLFESFYRAKNTGSIAGNGLGLAIVQRAIDTHHGHIEVASTVGAGSTFTVTLPWQPVTI